MTTEVRPKDALLEKLKKQAKNFARPDEREKVGEMIDKVNDVGSAVELKMFIVANYRQSISQMPKMAEGGMIRFLEQQLQAERFLNDLTLYAPLCEVESTT